MRRRAVLCVIAIISVLLVTSGTALTLLVHHIPAFYTRDAVPEGTERRGLCQEFLGHSTAFLNAFGSDQSSEHEFSQEQFNSYFQEQEGEAGPSARIVEIPEEVHDIRVALEHDRIRLGFRYGGGWCSTVVTIDFRVWLVARMPNVIALELCGFRAGALPLGTQVLLDYVSEAARRLGIEVTWYRSQGHPVALLQLQANQPRPTFQIRRLEVRGGRLLIACSPTREPGPPPPPITPAPPLPGTTPTSSDPPTGGGVQPGR
jgi:hypothetical protein